MTVFVRLLTLLLTVSVALSACGGASVDDPLALSATQSGSDNPAMAVTDPTTSPHTAATAGPTSAPDSGSDEVGPQTARSTSTGAAQIVEIPGTAPRPPAPHGRVAPSVASTPAELAAQVAASERGLRSTTATTQERADWGHLHQVAIRKLGYEPAWDVEFFEALPTEYRARTLLHVSARRALVDLASGYDAADFIPAWEIVDAEPIDSLLTYYQQAEAATGIDWEYLAAINLVETGMGRIRGLSSAGAQGPMQFLPTTWAEAGIGEGDINDPRDAINAAARYLVRRGGPDDMAGAIWGYNNSRDYVTAVTAYAEILRQDPAAYDAIYHWEIYFFTEAGDVWLPTGFRAEEAIDLADFLAANPWSAPDAGLR